MSEETPEAEAKEVTTTEAVEEASKENLVEKYRLISGEEVLADGEARPSTLAFIGMYFVGLIVFGVHWLFEFGVSTSDDTHILLKMIDGLIQLTGSEEVPIAFVLLMGTIAWINRMLNVSTSGRWVTTAILLSMAVPVVIQLDNVIAWFAGIFGKEFGAVSYTHLTLPTIYSV